MFITLFSTDRDFSHIIINTDQRTARMPDRKYLSLFGSTSLDMLEDLLYILWELTPTHREWKSHLAAQDACVFDYHGVDFFRLQRIGDYVYGIDFGE